MDFEDYDPEDPDCAMLFALKGWIKQRVVQPADIRTITIYFNVFDQIKQRFFASILGDFRELQELIIHAPAVVVDGVLMKRLAGCCPLLERVIIEPSAESMQVVEEPPYQSLKDLLAIIFQCEALTHVCMPVYTEMGFESLLLSKAFLTQFRQAFSRQPLRYEERASQVRRRKLLLSEFAWPVSADCFVNLVLVSMVREGKPSEQLQHTLHLLRAYNGMPKLELVSLFEKSVLHQQLYQQQVTRECLMAIQADVLTLPVEKAVAGEALLELTYPMRHQEVTIALRAAVSKLERRLRQAEVGIEASSMHPQLVRQVVQTVDAATHPLCVRAVSPARSPSPPALHSAAAAAASPPP
jgi:hypothetical protein